jgi:hypothetical protein
MAQYLDFTKGRYIPKHGDCWVNTRDGSQYTYVDSQTISITSSEDANTLSFKPSRITHDKWIVDLITPKVDTNIYPFKE